MSSHRADKYRARRPNLSAAKASIPSAIQPGRRKTVRTRKRSTSSSASSLIGGAVLVAAAIGAATTNHAISSPASQAIPTASRHEGTYVARLSDAANQGSNVAQISRSAARPDLSKNNGLLTAAQQQAAARKTSLASAGDDAESYAEELERAERQAQRKAQRQADNKAERQAQRKAERQATRQAAADDGSTTAAPDDDTAPTTTPDDDTAPTTTTPTAPDPTTSSGGWVLPTSGYSISTWFGEAGSYWSSGYHTGVDFAAAYGTPVVAATSAVVVQTGWDGAYGNQIRIQIENGDQIWYNHLSSIEVTVGQAVSPGTPIGRVGETGNAYGAHLHLEYRLASDLGTGVDPVPYFSAHGIGF